MERTARNRNQLPTNLPQLQNLIKRDKAAYKDEFLQQYQHYESLLQLFLLDPSQESDSLRNLVMFLSQICHCYCEEMANFPNELMSLLSKHGPILEPEIRMTLCRGLILMRRKDFIEPQRLLTLFFELFRCEDKILRKVQAIDDPFLYELRFPTHALFCYIVSDIKHINTRRKNNKVNRSLQNLMYGIFSQSSAMTSRMSLNIMIELYKKNIWNDAKTVNVIATACFSKLTKVCVAALQFFLTGVDEGDGDDEGSSSEEESEARAMRTYIVSKQTVKKGRKRERKMKRALSTIKRKAKQKKKKPSQRLAVFSALHLLNDPQDFSEKLFHKLERSKDRFEVKLMMMSLISRLIGLHQLILFNFYPYVQTWYSKREHVSDTPKMLTYLAQAAHKLVPPEILEAPLRAIVNNFVSERNSSDVMAVGLNAVRELCVRCPLVMSEDLLRDLTAYKSYRDKSVMMAARSLIHVYRDINPEMLHRKDRGRPTEAADGAAKKVAEFGALDAVEAVPGTELIELPLEELMTAGIEEGSDGEFGLSDVEEEMGEMEEEEEEGVEEQREGGDVEDDEKEDEELDVSENKERTLPNTSLERTLPNTGLERTLPNTSLERTLPTTSLERTLPTTSLERTLPNMGLERTLPNTGLDRTLPNTGLERTLPNTGLERTLPNTSLEKTLPTTTLERTLPNTGLEQLKQQRKEAAALVSTTRFLTQEEFELIRRKQLSSSITPRKGKKRQLQDLLEDQEQRRHENGELLPEAAIHTVPHSRKRRNKEERLASVKEGREGREKFGSKKRKFNPDSSTTNKQKSKNKAFTMIKHKRSIRGKNKKSFREKQISLRNSLLKQRRHK